MSPEFQHILRVLNTNIEGKRKVMFAMTRITGIGRRFSNVICKKAEIDVDRRAGTLSNEEIEKLVAIINNPKQFKIPNYLLNRQKDFVTGKTTQQVINTLIGAVRNDIERLKKIRGGTMFFRSIYRLLIRLHYQSSPWYQTLLGPQMPRSAYQDYRPKRKDALHARRSWRCQVNLRSISVCTYGNLSLITYHTNLAVTLFSL
jgi:small subunit ribosomal protein S18e